MKNKKTITIILSCLSLIFLITGLWLAATYGDTFKTEEISLLLVLTIGCILVSILMIGALFGLFLFSLSKSAYPAKPAQLDERQILVNGKGAEYGLLTVAIAAFVVYFWEDAFEFPPLAETGATAVLIALLGVLVYGVYRIWHGAYFAINGNPKYIIALLGVCTILSLMAGISDLLKGKLIANGVLTSDCIMLATSIICLSWLATIGLKTLKDRKDEDA